MSLIKNHIDSLRIADDQLELIARKAVIDNSEVILSLLKDGQLRKSIMSSGKLAPFYSKNTFSFALADEPITGASSKTDVDRYNFEWSGEWLKDMYIAIESNSDGFDILSSAQKTSILEEMTGSKLTALTEKNNNKVNEEIILPKLFDHFIDALINF